jgi:hypothetical protein
MPKLQMDEEGHVVVRGDKIVYLDDAETEIELDWAHAISKVRAVSDERDAARSELKAAQKELTGLKSKYGDLDVDQARQAIQTVTDLDSSKLVEAGKVDQIRSELKTTFESQVDNVKAEYVEAIEERDMLLRAKDRKIYDLMVSNQFRASEYVTSQLLIPPGKAELIYRDHFVIVDDVLVPLFDPDAGEKAEKVYSKARPGELADFEEAIKLIVERDPDKERIVKGKQASGSGAVGALGSTGPAMGTGMHGGSASQQTGTLNPVEALKAARKQIQ